MKNMKKNNIILFLLMMLPTLLLTSCLKDQEDTFSESASIRTANYLNNVKKVLTSSEQGWILNYYPDREQSYGGTVYTLKFTEDDVTVSSELTDGEIEHTSLYSLKNEDGPVLVFDTYNPQMHYYATPTGSSGAGGYEAYDGDFILIVMNISEDQNTITLKGNRSGNTMYMHRLTGAGTDYLTKIAETRNTMPTNYTMVSNGETVKITFASGRISFTSDNVNESGAYIYTDNGIEFYEPITINEVEIKGIVYPGDSETTTATNNKDVVFNVVFPPINETFVNGEWYIAYSKLGAFAQPYFDKAKAGSAGEGEVISLLALTPLTTTSTGLYFVSGNYTGALAFDWELIDDDKVKLTYNAVNNYNNGEWYYKNAGYNNLVVPLARTFKLEANKKINPSAVTMYDVDEPTNVITVSANPISNPFDN